MSKTFWMISSFLFSAMVLISQWHLNTNNEIYRGEIAGWLYVTRSLAEKITREVEYSQKLEAVIRDFDLDVQITPVEPEGEVI